MRGIILTMPQVAASHASKFKRVLVDREPSVMMAALSLFRVLVETSPTTYKSLLSAFIHIQRQLIERRLPTDFDHHKVPALWAQVNCLQILGMLAAHNDTGYEELRSVLHDSVRLALECGDAGYAVVDEALKVLAVRPIAAGKPEDVTLARDIIQRFTASRNRTIQTMTLGFIQSGWKLDRAVFEENREFVEVCCESDDEGVQRRAMRLLSQTTDTTTFQTYITRIIAIASSTTNPEYITELIHSLSQHFQTIPTPAQEKTQIYLSLLVNLRPEHHLAISNTENPVTFLCSELTELLVANEGEDVRGRVVEACVAVLMGFAEGMGAGDGGGREENGLVGFALWVVGEYGSGNVGGGDIVEVLGRGLERCLEGRDWKVAARVLESLSGVVRRVGDCSDEVVEVVGKFKGVGDLDVQHRYHEFVGTLKKIGKDIV
ncbi:AP-4 complex subunit epsilon-1 [Rhizophlyctis rosea]|nr:AP-4 complex subunit epsilon-1 [Rhizophlyctis rosea]